MKSLTSVVCSILHDCGMQCGANPIQDIRTVLRRVENEGDSFLTITLPTFAEALERALDGGCWSTALAPSFTRGRKRCLPRFLGGFTDQVFDSGGMLLEDPSVASIRAVRQICKAVSRLFLVCSDERTKKAATRFSEIDAETRHAGDISPSLLGAFDYVSSVVWSGLVSGPPGSGGLFDQLIPRHGPGTTAEGIRGNLKYDFREWPQRLEHDLPFAEFGISSILNDEGFDRATKIAYPAPRDERPVNVVFVPKTAKKPRVIAIEPVAMQYMQQAIADWIRPRIETLGRFTAGHVNFRDQSVNSNFARLGSLGGGQATLDMSDASDRVSCSLVSRSLKSVPEFRRYVFATRTSRAKLPNGSIIPLKKFASMGSALCFPIESMIFFLILVSGRMARSGKRLTSREIYLKSRDIYVYGDDLIVPVDEAPAIVADLEAFGLKVNSAKSFWTGKFRESCGRDYFNGEDVTPVYLRRVIPSNRADVHGIVSLVAFTNQLYWAGLWKTAKTLRKTTETIIGKLPCIATHMQVLGWHSFSNAVTHHAWHKDFQRVKTRCIVPVPKRSADPLDGDAALLKCWRLIGIQNSPVSLEHLLTSVRSGNLALKRRWI